MEKDNLIIRQTLDLINKQIGLKLELDYYFTGLKSHRGEKYFNVMLSDRVFCSRDYAMLESFSSKYNLIKVEPNGLKRVAIFPCF